MRLKDIEKNLKDEREAERVPDVYARVQKAPLNKLLEGETPVRAFQKQVAMRLLVTVLLLFAVAALCIGALWLTESPSPAVPECKVMLLIDRGGAETRYDIVVKNEFDIASVLKYGDGRGNSDAEVINSYSIRDFITPQNGDKIRINADCADGARAQKVFGKVVDELSFIYGDIPFEIL